MAKIWYEISAECIKENSGLTCKAGDKEVLAKVKSKGLAEMSRQVFEKVYGENFKITIA